MNIQTTALPPHAEMVRAMLERDTAYEGVFFTAVKTTGIFCRPSCTARKPKPENVEFFAHADDCLSAGYRACLRCKPLDAAAIAPDWVQRLLSAVDADPEVRWSDAQLLAEGIEPLKLRRWFKQHFGMTFHAWLRTRRLGMALGGIKQGASIDHAAFDSGYESLSGFRDAFQKSFNITPGRVAQSEPLLFTRLTTPLGPMIAMAERRGLVLLEFLDRPALTREVEQLQARYGYAVAPGHNAHLQQIETQLAEYFAGRLNEFSVALHLPGSEFDRQVWAALLQIPYGHTSTYGAIAATLGKPGASRAVGLANGHNRLSIVVPCHRVIGADGALTGYGGGQPRKAFLLRLENAATQLTQQLAF
ncbi:bifunctional transcriptional activator/DNA repair protein Ada [Pseudomonas granadensis]|uniref:Methylated-DNA--protein-cysteine methyltransferase n=1 Tax=Pseudomonas granadensis TaxID=1421430 RepID=A0ABX7GMS8_9PSED|nr:bifunctional transcriptional activator/DNA repair protein Ada [Pseudomonas granadensis]MBN6772782.1 bifunctional transcriptional activator/DNA repair protein Ada [Pseudomonas granadensis]MBN6806278.1 bifunctional transcriptional activator/DNA repair protein Ada [Pseudomonas granadensis]MBN6830857.1 bifunctional transcriptional activator/DNA repair protein Ada [Pseudomonas granadensis]MBN6840861.1 bifunctional transcriptional activator/DNA repair protein Ada [Pseudomonas granadensis]MBN68677